MRWPAARTPSSMTTGCYEILSDLITDLRGSEVLLGAPIHSDVLTQMVSRRVVAALAGPAPLTRCAIDRVKVLPHGRYWVVIRIFIEASGSDFEPDQLGAACAQVAELLDGPIRELCSNIYMWNVRMTYREKMSWV